MYEFKTITEVDLLLYASNYLLDEIRKKSSVYDYSVGEGTPLVRLGKQIESLRLQSQELDKRIMELLNN